MALVVGHVQPTTFYKRQLDIVRLGPFGLRPLTRMDHQKLISWTRAATHEDFRYSFLEHFFISISLHVYVASIFVLSVLSNFILASSSVHFLLESVPVVRLPLAIT